MKRLFLSKHGKKITIQHDRIARLAISHRAEFAAKHQFVNLDSTALRGESLDDLLVLTSISTSRGE
jgi:hypothetical protein